MNELTLRRPIDWHLHLRRGRIMQQVLPFTVAQFGKALIMPNTRPAPILSGLDAREYKDEIMGALDSELKNDFEPLMTIQITSETTPEMILKAKGSGVIAGKVYPRGVTTNSENGVVDYDALFDVFSSMSEAKMVLSLHGESPDPAVEGICKEIDFLNTLTRITTNFPDLRVVLEHITTREAVECVKALPRNVAGTITVHHLQTCLDDVIGYSRSSNGFLQPHLYCKPIPKGPLDRRALVACALSGDPNFFYGGDSAPHPRNMKETDMCCAGVFNAPVAMQILTEMFVENGDVTALERFVSYSGAEFYNVEPCRGSITLVKKSWVVPPLYGDLVAFKAGEEVGWALAP